MHPEDSEATLDRQKQQMVDYLDALYHRWVLMRGPDSQASTELSAQQVRTVGIIAYRGRSTMTDLANALSVPLSTATRMVDRLVDKGQLVRIRSESDRRTVEVELSEEGKAGRTAFLALRYGMAHEMLAPLTAGERQIFVELLAKMTRAAERDPQAASPGTAPQR